jgi:transglutaminase-like putative cysteine protease
MRISVVHTTVYRYESPVHLEPHTFRLRPREDGAQRLIDYSMEILPAPAGRSVCLDQDGNVVLEVWFTSPVDVLSARSAFQMETLRENPFDFLLARPESYTLPLVYAEPWRASLAPYMTVGTPPPVREFTAAAVQKAGGKTLGFLNVLNGSLFETCRHENRDQGPPLAPEVTLAQGAGSCRDLAVLFCAACRTVGIAARFVSGYEADSAIDDEPHMHAWAEVYLPGGGWRGYDPSRGLAVSTSHVAVAAAADPQLAAPVSGTYRGAVPGKMDFTIAMQVDPVPA